MDKNNKLDDLTIRVREKSRSKIYKSVGTNRANGRSIELESNVSLSLW